MPFVLFLALFAPMAQQSPRVLVLGDSKLPDSATGIELSARLGEALAQRGVNVMTSADIRALFRAAACTEGLEEIDPHVVPFRLMRMLSDRGVRIVYSGEKVNGMIHLLAIDTKKGRVVTRRTLSGHNLTRKVRRAATAMSKSLRHKKGRRVFAGIGSDRSWDALVATATRSRRGIRAGRCLLPPVDTSFDVVLRAGRDKTERIVVRGEDDEAFAEQETTENTYDFLARDLENEIDRVSYPDK